MRNKPPVPPVPFLRNTNNGRIFPWTEALSKHEAMEPYFGEENDTEVIFIDVDEAAVTASAEAESTDFNTMSWQQLKKMVEAAGGTYVSRTDAIDFLTSKA